MDRVLGHRRPNDGRSVPRLLLPAPVPSGPGGTGTVGGRVVGTDGVPVAQASVRRADTGDAVATTGADGRFSVSVPAGEARAFRVDSDGRGDAAGAAPAGDAPASLTVGAGDSLVAFSDPLAPDGVTHRTRDGGSVTVPPGGLVRADGSPMLGEVLLTVARVVVSNGAGADDASSAPAVSVGATRYELTADGAEVRLVDGTAAVFEIPLRVGTRRDGTALAPGNAVPLWSLDPDTGRWKASDPETVVAAPASLMAHGAGGDDPRPHVMSTG